MTSLLPTTFAAQKSLPQATINQLYRPFIIQNPIPIIKENGNSNGVVVESEIVDWVDELELDYVQEMVKTLPEKMNVLILYGSLRERSFSRLTAFEAARILHRIGGGQIDVRVYNPTGLPMKDGVSEGHEKVMEIRSLFEWSDAQYWSCPEQHGTITAVMKNQLDWIPLSTGSVRPSQNRVLAVSQISGGSQSFNTVNLLRQLGRWLRFFTIPNQSSLPLAWKCFTSEDRLMPSSNRDRIVDCCEELVKTTVLLKPHRSTFDSRYSERNERRIQGKLRTQAEKEAEKDAVAAVAAVAAAKI